jgi:tetratricopeptide (TPR) repeat protein
VAGVADIEEGNINQSVEKLKKAVELREDMFRDVVEIYVGKINQPQLAIEIAGDNIYRLEYLKEILSGDEEQENYAKQVDKLLTNVLEKECLRPDASTKALLSLADIYRQQKEKKALAAELYHRALSANYAAVEWRLNLAKVLAETGKTAEAMHEARICLKLQPQSKEAEKLLGELAVQTATSMEENRELQ